VTSRRRDDGAPPSADPLALLARMWLIRAFEEKASEVYA
jgi:TPP-dependent pyruvate/acetoin dehydrogenase alpha subunit